MPSILRKNSGVKLLRYEEFNEKQALIALISLEESEFDPRRSCVEVEVARPAVGRARGGERPSNGRARRNLAH